MKRWNWNELENLVPARFRIVYKLERTDNAMLVIVIGMRADNEVYKTAYQRIVIRDFVVNESSF